MCGLELAAVDWVSRIEDMCERRKEGLGMRRAGVLWSGRVIAG